MGKYRFFGGKTRGLEASRLADKPWLSELAGLTLRYLHEAAAVIPSRMQLAELATLFLGTMHRLPGTKSASLGYTREPLPQLGTVAAGTGSRPRLLVSCVVVLSFPLPSSPFPIYSQI